MICKTCGAKMYVISDLCLDSEQIREAEYCNSCGTVWRVTKGGIEKYKITKPPYNPTEKEQLRSLCNRILKELDNEIPKTFPTSVEENSEKWLRIKA